MTRFAGERRFASDRAGAEVRCAGVVHVYDVHGTDVAALRGVDLDVAPGERVALLGPSGSGKSTLLSIVAGLRRPSAGKVVVDGDDISRWSERQLYAYRAASVGLLLQGSIASLLPYATPAENVAFATGGASRNPVLEVSGLGGESRPVAALSRATQQSVALAVATARRPRLLLVDEPTNHLGVASRDALLATLVEVTEAAGTTVLLVTHDEEVAGRMQRMVRMRGGRVGSEGLRHDQYAVVGADGSVQLPEGLTTTWPAGSRVRVDAVGPDELRIRRGADGDGVRS